MDERAMLPARANPGAVGFDLHLLEATIVKSGSTTRLRTGIRATPPPGVYLRVNGRSGLSSDGFLVQSGVIDRDYTGEIQVIMHNSTVIDAYFSSGMRIAQMIPELFAESCNVEELSSTDQLPVVNSSRGARGFGSTGI